MRKPLTEKIEKYQKAGWWWPAQSEQAALMLVVPKKDNLICTVINAQKLSANTVKDVTPFPNQDLIHLYVAQAKHCSKINLLNAYEQVWVEPGDIWKTAFTTIQGVIESLVMQQGNCNAPTTLSGFDPLWMEYIMVALGWLQWPS